jgi:membrane protein DedA with SNARE-associated domain
MHQIIQNLSDWYLHALQSLGAVAVLLLMIMESSFLPLPSEVIIPPAAHLADTGQISVGFTAIILAGALGSWLGSTIMYWLARLAGRPLVLRYGRLVLFPPEKLEKAERWMSHYGAMGVFVARLLPGARQLVGIPAGIARLSYLKFSIFTLLGATIWCSVLCYVGVKAGQDEKLMHGELHHVVVWLGGAVLVLGALYYLFVHRHMAKKAQ